MSGHIPFFLSVYSAGFAAFFLFVHWLKRRDPARPDSKAAITLIFSVAIFFRLGLLQTAPSLSDDIYRYVWDGRVQQAGINPYLFPPSAPELDRLRDENYPLINHKDLRTVYPPLAQQFFRLGAWIKPTLSVQRFIFVLFDVGVIFIVMLLLKARRQSVWWSTLYAWNPLAIVEFAGSGHVDSLMLFFLLLGIYLWVVKKPFAGAVSFALSVLSKLIPVVMIPWLVVQKRWRLLLIYGGVIVLGCWPFFHGFQAIYGQMSPALSGIKTYSRDWVFNPSLYGALGYFVENPSYRKFILGFFLAGFSFWWALKNKDHPLRYAFGALFALLLASPVVHPWYVTWLLPFLCFFPLWSGLTWSYLVGVTYLVLIRYHAEGVWHLSPWIVWGEYGVVYSLLIREFLIRHTGESPGRHSRESGNPGRKPFFKFYEELDSRSACKAAVWNDELGFRRYDGASQILNPNPSITIIIPALNEEKPLPLVLSEIPKNLVKQVIVVDNGSSDQTAQVAREGGATVLFEPIRGYGRAVQRGLSQLPADCDIVVILDGDHSDFPEDLPKLLEPLKNGEADMVIGSRTHAALPGSLMPQQRFGNWLTCFLIAQLYGQRFTDMGPFRAIRRSVLDDLKMEDQNFGWNVEMQIKALKKRYRVAEVPVRYRPRLGQSKISGTLKGSLHAGTIILWSIYKYSRLKT